MTKGVALDLATTPEQKFKKKKRDFLKKHKIEGHYASELMWSHHQNGRDDLIEMVKDGFINRKARRAEMFGKKHKKPTRMSKAECVQTLAFYRKMEAYAPNTAE